MTDPLDQDDAATPLTPEEQAGLIPSYITLRHELNEAEQANILEAGERAFARKRNILDETLLKSLHKRMFGRVWRWAGEFRLTERNIGVAPHRIGIDLRNLLDDCRHWIEHGTYPPDELRPDFITASCGFILSRTAMAVMRGWPPRLASRAFHGAGSALSMAETRRAYVAALRAADAQDIQPLLEFVRA